jgi:Amidase
MSSLIDGILSTFTDQGVSGPNPKGHFPLAAIEFYQNVRHARGNDYPVTVKTVLLFALAMRRRYGYYYSAKAQNLVRTMRAAYDNAFAHCDILVMPTTVMKAHLIPPPNAGPEVIMGCALDMVGNTMPFDGTGHPSMSVPAGFSQGLPVGMMTTKAANAGGQYSLRWTEYCAELLNLDPGGLYSATNSRSGPEPFDEPWPRSNSTFDQNYLAAFVLRVRAAFLSRGAEP